MSAFKVNARKQTSDNYKKKIVDILFTPRDPYSTVVADEHVLGWLYPIQDHRAWEVKHTKNIK